MPPALRLASSACSMTIRPLGLLPCRRLRAHSPSHRPLALWYLQRPWGPRWSMPRPPPQRSWTQPDHAVLRPPTSSALPTLPMPNLRRTRCSAHAEHDVLPSLPPYGDTCAPLQQQSCKRRSGHRGNSGGKVDEEGGWRKSRGCAPRAEAARSGPWPLGRSCAAWSPRPSASG